eukprot:GHVN01082896.1.p1 GENE.GHVN01082896.1~~GHVN01082896.1.p1  ORF type:complete len:475 (+),score=61.82 GHVN01082896.1:69-1493(+)
MSEVPTPDEGAAYCQGCGDETRNTLVCPRCSSMGRTSFFCSQACFNSNWAAHNKLHLIMKQQSVGNVLRSAPLSPLPSPQEVNQPIVDVELDDFGPRGGSSGDRGGSSAVKVEPDQQQEGKKKSSSTVSNSTTSSSGPSSPSPPRSFANLPLPDSDAVGLPATFGSHLSDGCTKLPPSPTSLVSAAACHSPIRSPNAEVIGSTVGLPSPAVNGTSPCSPETAVLPIMLSCSSPKFQLPSCTELLASPVGQSVSRLGFSLSRNIQRFVQQRAIGEVETSSSSRPAPLKQTTSKTDSDIPTSSSTVPPKSISTASPLDYTSPVMSRVRRSNSASAQVAVSATRAAGSKGVLRCYLAIGVLSILMLLVKMLLLHVRSRQANHLIPNSDQSAFGFGVQDHAKRKGFPRSNSVNLTGVTDDAAKFQQYQHEELKPINSEREEKLLKETQDPELKFLQKKVENQQLMIDELVKKLEAQAK